MSQISAINRILERYPYLSKRNKGFPNVGQRKDQKKFSKIVEDVENGFSFYNDIISNYYNPKKDYNFTSGNPLHYPMFPPTKEALLDTILKDDLYKYPYSEGDDKVRSELLKYIEHEGIYNDQPYHYDDIDDKGMSINNLTLTVSTSHAFDLVLEIIARDNDVIIMTGPNYGLFSFKPERKNINVEIIELEAEDGYLVNPDKLDEKITQINKRLMRQYEGSKYIPRVVAFVNGNPSNPTGKVMGKNELHLLTGIGEVCKKHDLFIIDDLIYRDITYDRHNIALPMASIKGMFKNTISLFGLSKSYGLASFRAGFVVADEVIIREIINKIFQQMDAVPVIIGEALKGSFMISDKRNREYSKYFKQLTNQYIYRYNLLKGLVMGIDCINDLYKEDILHDVEKINQEGTRLLRLGVPYVNILNHLEPEAGFFVILDFTGLKGKKYQNIIIQTEEDLARVFYQTIHVRFIMGKSIAWPNSDMLIGRFTFAKEIKEIIDAFVLIDNLIHQFD